MLSKTRFSKLKLPKLVLSEVKAFLCKVGPLCRKNKILTAVIFGLLCFGIYHFVFKSSDIQADIKIVEVEKVGPHDIAQTVRLLGTIQAKRSTVLTAKATGFLEHVAHAGQKLSKGNLIAKLDNNEIEKNYKLSQSAEKIAKDQFDRRTQLHKGNISSKKDLEDARTVWIEAQKSLSAAKIEYDKTKFEAPFDGVVGTYKIREGTQVQGGDAIGLFYDPTDLIIDFNIPAPLLNKLSNTSALIVNKQSLKVLHIQKMIDPDTHMSPAYADYPCAGIIGSVLDIDLAIEERKNVLTIPYEAVFLRNGNTFVYLVKDNKATLTSVELGLQVKDKVEIKEGLSKDDLIIVRGHGRLYPDISVKIHETEKQSSYAK